MNANEYGKFFVGVKEGECLGAMKREFPDRLIYDFFAGGPKNYGFRHRSMLNFPNADDDKCELKIRGLTLHYNAKQTCNYESVKQLVLERNSDYQYVRHSSQFYLLHL